MTERDRTERERRERLAGTRERIQDAVKEAAREQHEREKERVLGRAEETVRRMRESGPASAPPDGRLGKKNRKRPGIGRPPWA